MDTELVQSLSDATGIVFLCSGNIIRSAFAEILSKNRGCALPVFSAATTYRNARISDEAHNALTSRGVPSAEIADFHPKHYEEIEGDVEPNTVHFSMTRGHMNYLVECGEPPNHSFLLNELLGRATEIQDPYFHGGFKEVFEQIDTCIQALVDEVKTLHGN